MSDCFILFYNIFLVIRWKECKVLVYRYMCERRLGGKTRDFVSLIDLSSSCAEIVNSHFRMFYFEKSWLVNEHFLAFSRCVRVLNFQNVASKSCTYNPQCSQHASMWLVEAGKPRLFFSAACFWKPSETSGISASRATVCSAAGASPASHTCLLWGRLRVQLLVFLIATGNPLEHWCASRSDSHTHNTHTLTHAVRDQHSSTVDVFHPHSLNYWNPINYWYGLLWKQRRWWLVLFVAVKLYKILPLLCFVRDWI